MACGILWGAAAPPTAEGLVRDPDACWDDECYDQTTDSTYDGIDTDLDPLLASF